MFKFPKVSRARLVIMFLVCVGVVLLDYLLPGVVPAGESVVQAGLLGALVTGAGVTTTFAGQGQLEQYITIGDVSTANPLQGLYISVDGDTKIDIQNAPLITAFLKLYNGFVGTAVGNMLKVSTARIIGNTTYRFVNAGATTPNIFVSSANSDLPACVSAQTVQINANSNMVFDDFTALLVINTNLSSFDMTWNDSVSTTQNMAVVEVDGLFSEDNQTDANGRLQATVTACDNRGQMFKSVKINVGAGGSALVLVVKLPDSYFKRLNARING